MPSATAAVVPRLGRRRALTRRSARTSTLPSSAAAAGATRIAAITGSQPAAGTALAAHGGASASACYDEVRRTVLHVARAAPASGCMSPALINRHSTAPTSVPTASTDSGARRRARTSCRLASSTNVDSQDASRRHRQRGVHCASKARRTAAATAARFRTCAGRTKGTDEDLGHAGGHGICLRSTSVAKRGGGAHSRRDDAEKAHRDGATASGGAHSGRDHAEKAHHRDGATASHYLS